MSANIDLVVITDGRGPYLEQTLSTVDHLCAVFVTRTIVDDSGVDWYSRWLRDRYGHEYRIVAHTQKRGLAAAVKTAWSLTSSAFVFHLEDDFTIDETVDVHSMAAVLAVNPKLAQLCLLRQPWNEQEHAAGGIIQADPTAYDQRKTIGKSWLAHRKLFSLNPCLIPRWVVDLGWDDGNERGFTDRLLADSDIEFGYWGVPTDQHVTHIGHQRSAGWQL